jgi:hypothetical protein
MRTAILLIATLVTANLTVACGPAVSEARLIAAPARPADCDLDFLRLSMNDVTPGAKYEVLGHVVLSQEGVQDPLQQEYRATVRPRACAMGGEGVAVMMTGTASPWALSAGGTTIDYLVVRKRQAQEKPAGPQKF